MDPLTLQRLMERFGLRPESPDLPAEHRRAESAAIAEHHVSRPVPTWAMQRVPPSFDPVTAAQIGQDIAEHTNPPAPVDVAPIQSEFAPNVPARVFNPALAPRPTTLPGLESAHGGGLRFASQPPRADHGDAGPSRAGTYRDLILADMRRRK